MAAPTPNATYNRVGTSLLFNTSYSVASGKALFVVANTVFINPSTPTGWTLARTGSNFKLFTRTANGTSTDNFGNSFYGTGLVFDSGVTEDYTSGTWDNTSSVAPAPNGGSALSSSTDELVIVAINYARTIWLDGDQVATDATPAATSGFTAGTSATAAGGNGPFNYFGVVDYWDWDDFAVQVQYKALTTSTPGTTTWGSYYSGADNAGFAPDVYNGQTYDGDTFYSATLAFKAASSGTAYTASASGTATATGTAAMSNARTSQASATETATGTAAASNQRALAASATGTATGTAAMSLTKAMSASATATATGTAGASSTQLFAASATVTATGTIVGSIRQLVTVDGVGTITATGTSTASNQKTLAASATATATASASMISIISVAAAGTATASATAATSSITRGAMSPLARTFQSMVFRARTTATMKGK